MTNFPLKDFARDLRDLLTKHNASLGDSNDHDGVHVTIADVTETIGWPRPGSEHYMQELNALADHRPEIDDMIQESQMVGKRVDALVFEFNANRSKITHDEQVAFTNQIAGLTKYFAALNEHISILEKK